mmetsp:Transcript_14465/g.31745  ORF Transcript_14465/g.31745 Transcript_14465/m.31745 type:complete len:513 (+) Transcript_14465:57-1595(+)
MKSWRSALKEKSGRGASIYGGRSQLMPHSSSAPERSSSSQTLKRLFGWEHPGHLLQQLPFLGSLRRLGSVQGTFPAACPLVPPPLGALLLPGPRGRCSVCVSRLGDGSRGCLGTLSAAPVLGFQGPSRRMRQEVRLYLALVAVAGHVICGLGSLLAAAVALAALVALHLGNGDFVFGRVGSVLNAGNVRGDIGLLCHEHLAQVLMMAARSRAPSLSKASCPAPVHGLSVMVRLLREQSELSAHAHPLGEDLEGSSPRLQLLLRLHEVLQGLLKLRIDQLIGGSRVVEPLLLSQEGSPPLAASPELLLEGSCQDRPARVHLCTEIVQLRADRVDHFLRVQAEFYQRQVTALRDLIQALLVLPAQLLLLLLLGKGLEDCQLRRIGDVEAVEGILQKFLRRAHVDHELLEVDTHLLIAGLHLRRTSPKCMVCSPQGLDLAGDSLILPLCDSILSLQVLQSFLVLSRLPLDRLLLLLVKLSKAFPKLIHLHAHSLIDLVGLDHEGSRVKGARVRRI